MPATMDIGQERAGLAHDALKAARDLRAATLKADDAMEAAYEIYRKYGDDPEMHDWYAKLYQKCTDIREGRYA